MKQIQWLYTPKWHCFICSDVCARDFYWIIAAFCVHWIEMVPSIAQAKVNDSMNYNVNAWIVRQSRFEHSDLEHNEEKKKTSENEKKQTYDVFSKQRNCLNSRKHFNVNVQQCNWKLLQSEKRKRETKQWLKCIQCIQVWKYSLWPGLLHLLPMFKHTHTRMKRYTCTQTTFSNNCLKCEALLPTNHSRNID